MKEKLNFGINSEDILLHNFDAEKIKFDAEKSSFKKCLMEKNIAIEKLRKEHENIERLLCETKTELNLLINEVASIVLRYKRKYK